MVVSRARKQHSDLKAILNFSFKVILLALFIMACKISINHFTQAYYFPIKTVKVFGINRVSPEYLQTALTPLAKKGFFGVDMDRIKEQLLQIPWVAETSVRRVWPDKIFIHITEKKAIALWNATSLLSSGGQLFTPAKTTFPETLPLFLGPEGKQILMAEYYAKISNLLLPLHFKITRLELAPTQDWLFTLGNDIKMNLGHKDVLTRLSHFVKVYPKIIGDRSAEVEYIDLRYPHGIAIRWKSATQSRLEV